MKPTFAFVGAKEIPSSRRSVSPQTIQKPFVSAAAQHGPQHTQHLLSLPTPMAPMVAPARAGMSFVQFLVVFTLGGLFFSTVLAGGTAVVAMGHENVLRLWSIVRLVATRVWEVLWLGLQETKRALRFDGRWNFRDAWNVLKRKLLETRQTLGEGVEAIRMEAKLYSAAVGTPGLIPIQYVINRLMPLSIHTLLKQAAKDALADMDENPHVKKATLVEFDSGKVAPQLLGARVYDLGSKALVFDMDVNWQSELEAKINLNTRRLGLKIPVTIRKFSFQGPVRVELSPLTSEPPGFGAALISLPSIPKLSSDIRVIGGDITKVSWLKNDVMKGVEGVLRETLLWPKRVVIPQRVPISSKNILSRKELQALESSDPFLTAEKTKMEKSMLRAYLTQLAGETESIPAQLQIAVGDRDLSFDGMDEGGDKVISEQELEHVVDDVASVDTVERHQEKKKSPRFAFWRKR